MQLATAILSKKVDAPESYNSDILFSIAKSQQRSGFTGPIEFKGANIWYA